VSSLAARAGRALGGGPRARRSGGEARPLPAGLPNFLIVGAQKAGTRWLRHNLAQHPEVYAASEEVWYFDHHFDRGVDWYRRQFPGWSGEPLVGESTPGYMFWANDPGRNAHRIDEQLPGVRLFAVLRDPAERAYSAFVHLMARGRVPARADLLEHVAAYAPEDDPLQLVAGGWYAASLAPFVERFGDRLRVFLTDDVRADARAVYRSALEHLGADPGFAPSELAAVRYSNPVPRLSRYRGRRGVRRPLTGSERRALYPYFADDVARLERLLGRDLSAWRPEGAR
jgi:hypothetical protein